MPALESLCHFLSFSSKYLSKEEKYLLELESFNSVMQELKKTIKHQNKFFSNLLKLNIQEENAMVEANIVRYVINDILKSEEYSLKGIAYYTDTPEEVILDIAIGRNTNPTLILVNKIIDIHRSIRKELYQSVIKKSLITHDH